LFSSSSMSFSNCTNWIVFSLSLGDSFIFFETSSIPFVCFFRDEYWSSLPSLFYSLLIFKFCEYTLSLTEPVFLLPDWSESMLLFIILIQ
jgi:hypothetical protein